MAISTEKKTALSNSIKGWINNIIAQLHTVASTGSYTDLENVPETFAPSAHTHAATEVSDANAHTNIGSAANANQGTINTNIDTALGNKANISSLANVATSGSYTDLSDKPTIYGPISVTKDATPTSGYAATYTIALEGYATSYKIDIPKDFLVRSAELKTATNQDLSTLGNGYSVGDKYIDFVINTAADEQGDTNHIYINVSDLVDIYDGDNSTITVSNGVISVASTKVSAWDGKTTMTEVESTINDLLDSLTSDFTVSQS